MTKTIVKVPLEIAVMLEDLHDYFDKRSDVVDGDYGQPEPNQAMVIANSIREMLDKIDAEDWDEKPS